LRFEQNFFGTTVYSNILYPVQEPG
jgi:hypothetical protein